MAPCETQPNLFALIAQGPPPGVKKNLASLIQKPPHPLPTSEDSNKVKTRPCAEFRRIEASPKIRNHTQRARLPLGQFQFTLKKRKAQPSPRPLFLNQSNANR